MIKKNYHIVVTIEVFSRMKRTKHLKMQQGRKEKKADIDHLAWRVPFEAITYTSTSQCFREPLRTDSSAAWYCITKREGRGRVENERMYERTIFFQKPDESNDITFQEIPTPLSNKKSSRCFLTSDCRGIPNVPARLWLASKIDKSREIKAAATESCWKEIKWKLG